ncbi:hypothetical protein ElyMa_006419400 [Elysia marginata]|uniref:RNase H type-1 domain-containing protein n=1 Tax=Elysia marginata TaxID=1093978 RepID=A0AAV4HX04_9GAST|nr:hypothetical protein ElyMa_006419400 [Elysia marginata]
MLFTAEKQLLEFRARVGELTLKWIPGPSNIEGNEKANNLPKLGLDQEETALKYQEAKIMIKMAAGDRWERDMKILTNEMTSTNSAESNKHPSLD